MTLQQLRYFDMVCNELHFSNAAKKLYVAQPTVSCAIKELEEELGTQLFFRQGNKLELTATGFILLNTTRKINAELSDCIKMIENKKRESVGQVNIGYQYSLSVDVLAPLIGEFSLYSKNQQPVFNFVAGNVSDFAASIINGSLDIVFSTDDIMIDIENSQLETFPFKRQEMFLVVNKKHPLAQKERIFFDDIKEENFVSINPGKGLRKQLDSYFQSMGVSPRIVFSLDTTEKLLSYVEAGVGVSILPRLPSMDMDKVSLLSISDYPVYRNIVMVHDRDRHHQKEARELIEFVHNHYRIIDDYKV